MVDRYDSSTVVAAEGARIALMSCLRCGAVVMADPRAEVDVVALHDAWHASLTGSSADTSNAREERP